MSSLVGHSAINALPLDSLVVECKNAIEERIIDLTVQIETLEIDLPGYHRISINLYSGEYTFLPQESGVHQVLNQDITDHFKQSITQALSLASQAILMNYIRHIQQQESSENSSIFSGLGLFSKTSPAQSILQTILKELALNDVANISNMKQVYEIIERFQKQATRYQPGNKK